MESSEGHFSVTATRLPMVDMTFHGALGVDDYRRTLDALIRIFNAHPAPFILLLDMREFNPLKITAAMRKQAAEVWHDNRELYLRVIVAEARVLTNPLTRGILTAFDWLTGTGKWPCRQFATMPAAETWLRSKLASHR